MIIPVGINHVIRGWPKVTLAIIAACTVVQVYSAVWAPSPEQIRDEIRERILEMPVAETEAEQTKLEERFAHDIEKLADRVPIARFGYRTGTGVNYRLVTSAFVHAGWFHLIGNMLFLWLAGAALEDRWGKAKFAAFFAAGAAASALFFAAMHDGPPTTLVGASGAISALMGAFLVCFARMQIYFLYWIGRGIGRLDVVAYIALPLWLAEQLFDSWWQSSLQVSSVAFTAHIGGFGFGFATAAIARLVGRYRERPEPVDGPPVARVVTERTRTAEPAVAEAPLAPLPIKAVEPPRPEPPPDPTSGPRFLK